jgi:hypothetical protein
MAEYKENPYLFEICLKNIIICRIMTCSLEASMRPETLENRILKRIARKRGDVFLRADFGDLGGYDQVGRVLRGLARKGRLLRIGQGLYARVDPEPSPIDGKPLPAKGLRELAAEALGRLGIKSGPTQLDLDYVQGRTTQVPAGRALAVDRRVRRRVGYNGAIMYFERARPAPR